MKMISKALLAEDSIFCYSKMHLPLETFYWLDAWIRLWIIIRVYDLAYSQVEYRNTELFTSKYSYLYEMAV